MSKPTTSLPTTEQHAALPALPPRRRRRRSVRPSHSWCFRKPPSRRRVEIACGRALPAPVPAESYAHHNQPDSEQ